MSKFEDTSESLGYKCPYCGSQHECDDWGYDYDGQEMECDECNKKFYATANHSVDFDSEPDCELNNEDHVLTFYKKHDNGDAYFCDTCGKCVIKLKQLREGSEK